MTGARAARVSMTLPQLRRGECTIWPATPGVCPHRQRLAPQLADLLALLLVSPPDRPLALATIFDALWPDEEPLHADKVVQVRIAQLRAAGVPVVTQRTFGYRIPVEARHDGFPLIDRMKVAA